MTSTRELHALVKRLSDLSESLSLRFLEATGNWRAAYEDSQNELDAIRDELAAALRKIEQGGGARTADHAEEPGLDLSQFEGHTPGPWLVDEDLRDGMEWNRHIVAGGDLLGSEIRICFMAHGGGRTPERDVANARLIAAAPLLLAELRRLRDVRAPASGVVTEAIRISCSAYDLLRRELPATSRIIDVRNGETFVLGIKIELIDLPPSNLYAHHYEKAIAQWWASDIENRPALTPQFVRNSAIEIATKEANNG